MGSALQEAELETVRRVAKSCAKRFANRVFWADFGDLLQEAYLSALTAVRSWDPEVGVPLRAYLWRACVNGLTLYCWKQSSPVSETDHRIKDGELRDVFHTELSDELPLDDGTSPEHMLQDASWNHGVRVQLSFLLQQVQGEKATAAALRVLLDEEPSSHVADTEGLSTKQVYRATLRARQSIASNALLYSLWKDR